MTRNLNGTLETAIAAAWTCSCSPIAPNLYIVEYSPQVSKLGGTGMGIVTPEYVSDIGLQPEMSRPE